jgi:hypothetical protein
MVIMGIGLLQGLLSWLSWPIWFWLISRELGQPAVISAVVP